MILLYTNSSASLRRVIPSWFTHPKKSTNLMRKLSFTSPKTSLIVSELGNKSIYSTLSNLFFSELVILEESVHEHISEKNSLHPQNGSKTFESPSERSLHKDEAQSQKKAAGVKIRNTSLVTSAKGQKRNPSATPLGKGENAKNTNNTNNTSSQPVSQNLPTEGDEKKKDENQPKQENHKSPAKSNASPKRDASPKKVATPKRDATAQEASFKETKSPSSTNASIRPLDLFEDETEGYLKTYLEKIDKSMHDSFLSDPKVLLERANMGQDPMWFELVDGGKPAGLAVAHIDNTAFTTRRLVILHFTAENRELYQDFLGKFVEYLWNNDECKEIKISLYYLEDQNNNLGADKQLQECIKKLGFRWKQLTNDKYTNKRYIDYIIKRPENIVSTGVKA